MWRRCDAMWRGGALSSTGEDASETACCSRLSGGCWLCSVHSSNSSSGAVLLSVRGQMRERCNVPTQQPHC